MKKPTPKTIIVWCSGWKLSIPFPLARALRLSEGQPITPELAATITTGQPAASSKIAMGAAIAGNGEARR